MYGLAPLYGIGAQSPRHAKESAIATVGDEIPASVEYAIWDASTAGGSDEGYYSVEVEVVFPAADTGDDLPGRDKLFEGAESVSVMAVEEVE